MREYVTVLDPSIVASLPADCQAALQDPDIQSAAVALLQCELRFAGGDEMQQLLHEIAHTYAAAAIRLTAINKGSGLPAAD